MKLMKLLWSVCLLVPMIALAGGGGPSIPLERARIDLTDHASLQRGAKLYVNYCMGCHSMQYMRYKRMAKDIGIVDVNGKVEDKLVKKNLIFTGDMIFDTMRNAMPEKMAKKWFGVPPPDLTLVARVRGVNWLYTYLLGFYVDNKKQWGTNNILFPDVAMPNVLAHLQGDQVPHYAADGVTVDRLQLKTMGEMNTLQFRDAMNDLVNFLAYSAEPVQLARERIGKWVLLFLAVFIVLTAVLKHEYWKDVK